MALQWTSTLSVGDGEIDAQHRELFQRVDRLLDAMLRRERTEAPRLLAFLLEYAVVHFEAEERLMAATGYPGAARHLQEHAGFRAALRALQERFDEQGVTAALVLQLEKQAVGWLKDHVYFTDAALGRWVLAGHGEAATRRE